MSNKATTAIRAAQNQHVWGPFAAWRYCQRRGVSMRLYALAQYCEAMAARN